MTYEALGIERDGGLARLTFADAAKGNPIDAVFCAELCDAAIELSGDKPTFCGE